MAGMVLSVEKREKTGTGGARAARKADLIPGVLYGGARGAVPIELKAIEIEKALRSGKFVSHLIEIDHKGERQPVIPRAIQYHPVSDKPIHIDLYRVEENSVINVDVVVHFKNHDASPGLKRGGALNIVRHTISLRVPANNIPEEVVVDLTGYEIGDSIHVSKVQLPEGVQPTIRGRDFTIASIAGRIAEEAAPAAAAATPAEGAAPAAEAEKKES
jgi:large subunit ribosomal protein L25